MIDSVSEQLEEIFSLDALVLWGVLWSQSLRVASGAHVNGFQSKFFSNQKVQDDIFSKLHLKICFAPKIILCQVNHRKQLVEKQKFPKGGVLVLLSNVSRQLQHVASDWQRKSLESLNLVPGQSLPPPVHRWFVSKHALAKSSSEQGVSCAPFICLLYVPNCWPSPVSGEQSSKTNALLMKVLFVILWFVPFALLQSWCDFSTEMTLFWVNTSKVLRAVFRRGCGANQSNPQQEHSCRLLRSETCDRLLTLAN